MSWLPPAELYFLLCQTTRSTQSSFFFADVSFFFFPPPKMSKILFVFLRKSLTFPVWTDLKAVRRTLQAVGPGAPFTVLLMPLASWPQPFSPVLRGEAALMWTVDSEERQLPRPCAGPRTGTVPSPLRRSKFFGWIWGPI